MKLPPLKSTAFKSAAIAVAIPGLALATPSVAADFQAPVQSGFVTSQTAFQTDANTEFGRGRNHAHRGNGYGRYDRYDRYDRDDRYDRYDRRRDRDYGEPVYRDTRVWRDRDGQYRCRKEDGTTGLVIGGAVGGLIGNELAGRGDRTLGAILGTAGGAILGRTIDRSNSRCR